jgi:hypothetical protein
MTTKSVTITPFNKTVGHTNRCLRYEWRVREVLSMSPLDECIEKLEEQIKRLEKEYEHYMTIPRVPSNAADCRLKIRCFEEALQLIRLAQKEMRERVEVLIDWTDRPTIQARDWKETDAVPNLIEGAGKQTGNKLRLQPAFTEWMMGLPEGWTDFQLPEGGLKGSRCAATESSRKSRRKSLGQ